MFMRCDGPTFNQNCPITLERFVNNMKPVAVIAQIQRHITTLSTDRLAEAEPYSSLAKINIQLPTSVADITDLFG